MNLPPFITRLLRWSERHTKTDMVYLASGGFWMVLAQGISSGSALALALVLGNFLPPETYGTYKYVLSIAGILSIFVLPGMDTAYVRATAQGHAGTAGAIANVRMRWGLVGGGIGLLGSLYYYLNGNSELGTALLIIALTLPVFDTFTLYQAYYSGTGQFGRQARNHGIAQVVSVASLICAALLTDSVSVLLLAYFLPLLLVRLTLYRLTFRGMTPDDPAIERETVSYGWHLTLMNILSVVASNADKILIWQFLGPAEVAIYTFAVAMPEQLKGPLKGVSDLAFRKFAKQSPDHIRQGLPGLWRKLLLYALGLLGISIAYIIAAPLLFSVLFPQYQESVFYSQIFMVSALGLVGTIPLAVLGAHRKLKEQYIFFTSQPVLQILLYLLLIPFWGIMGAIVARILMRVLYVIQSILMLQASFKAPRT